MKIYRNNEVEIERTRRCLEALINELEALITFPPVKKYVM